MLSRRKTQGFGIAGLETYGGGGRQSGQVRFHFGADVVQEQAAGTEPTEIFTGEQPCPASDFKHVPTVAVGNVAFDGLGHVPGHVFLHSGLSVVAVGRFRKTLPYQCLVHSSPFPSSRRLNNDVS